MKRTALARKTPLRAMSKKHAERLRTVRITLAPSKSKLAKLAKDVGEMVSVELAKSVRFSTLKPKRPKTTKARQAAKGRACLLNVAGVCVYDNARVSLTHFRWLGECGMALKPDDLQGTPGCDACNHWTDSPTPRQVEDCGGRVAYERDRNYYAARALVRMRLLDALDAF